jgi:hypothetical protein
MSIYSMYEHSPTDDDMSYNKLCRKCVLALIDVLLMSSFITLRRSMTVYPVHSRRVNTKQKSRVVAGQHIVNVQCHCNVDVDSGWDCDFCLYFIMLGGLHVLYANELSNPEQYGNFLWQRLTKVCG